MAKKKKATKKAAESLYDLKEEIVEEAAKSTSKKPVSFKSLKAAKAYAEANGGKVVEKGKFYVR